MSLHSLGVIFGLFLLQEYINLVSFVKSDIISLEDTLSEFASGVGGGTALS